MLNFIVKVLDWGEDGYATANDTYAARESFQKEVAVWHKLDHPNVTKVQTSFLLIFYIQFIAISIINVKVTVVEIITQQFFHPSSLSQFIGASMGTSDLKIPSKSSSSDGLDSNPARACCVVVEYLAGGTLKQYLIRNRQKKLAFKVVIQLALDLARG